MIRRNLLSLTVASCTAAFTVSAQAAEFVSPSESSFATILLDNLEVSNQRRAASLMALNAGTGLQLGQIYRLESLLPANSRLPEDAQYNAADGLLYIQALRVTDQFRHSVTLLMTSTNPAQFTVVDLNSTLVNPDNSTVVELNSADT